MSRRPLLRDGLIAMLVLLAIVVAAQDDQGSTEPANDGEDDAEFAFDLFSDIAPVLALFGEQFATQFASESLTWVDHLVFAMVPLGILTMITGAIRVSGPRIARSFIGRARENRALAEIELMSSTSAEVCELFNGRSVVRSMGKPEVAQFLIFPDAYDEAEALYDEDDRRRRNPTAASAPPPDPDLSYGIHSLQTAVRKSYTRGKRAKPRRMKCVDFHSHSYEVIEAFVRRYAALIWPGLQKEKSAKDVEAMDPGDETEGYFDPPGPPNLQLNLSSDHFEKAWMRKRHELFLAAVVAVVLQSGLIVIAVATVENEWLKDQIRFEPKAHGLPSYIVGSILLVFGMGLCSLAVEQSTTERAWKVLEKKPEPSSPAVADDLKHYPRLIWIQQGQTVSDQTFEPYAILAGPKRYVITSSRIEDAKDKEPAPHRKRTHRSGHGDSTSPYKYDGPNDSNISTTWEILTVIGVFSAGGGFVAQFIGLRGLAYPCSIAQLVAIFLMALVRALIRRRLGKIPGHTKAMAEYELEFLATHIVFCPAFRTFHQRSPENVQYLADKPAEEKYKWEVNLSKPDDKSPFYFRSAKELNARAATSSDVEEKPRSLQSESKSGLTGKVVSVSGHSVGVGSVDDYFHPASSQHLLRVRERLGDLCGWKSKSSDAALALVKSIEAFLDTFFPDTVDPDYPTRARRSKVSHKTLEKLDWIIEVRPPSMSGSTPRHTDTISLPIRRQRLLKTAPGDRRSSELPAGNERDGKWQVDLGKVEAALSLWMASIEANLSEERKEPERDKGGRGKGKDWRRSESGRGMKYRYARILGNNTGEDVLKRDLSWWVDELLVDQSFTFFSQDPDGTIPKDAAFLEIENPGGGKPIKWRRNPAVEKTDIQLVIGFHGRPPKSFREEGDPGMDECAVISNGYLPTILSQHLFTSFMWTISEYLPRDFLSQDLSSKEENVEIDGRHRFVLDELLDTWQRPTLRHRTLTKLVRQMETFGLGTMTDILLCIVPVLSAEDLLPNSAILKLVPEPQRGQSWSEIARAYRDVLDYIPISMLAEERFCYAVITRIMDFFYVACEPYDSSLLPPLELRLTLAQLFSSLRDFWPVVVKLAPVYDAQGRKKQFVRYFRFFEGENKDQNESGDADDVADKISQFERAGLSEMKTDFLERKLGFGKGHIRLLDSIKQEMEQQRGIPVEPKSAILPPQDPQVKARRDILTPESFGSTIKEQLKHLMKPDIFGWTPMHLASVHTDTLFFPVWQALGYQSLLKFTTNLKRNPYHLAALAGRDENLRAMLTDEMSRLTDEERRQAVTSSGLDGMTPLHLAAASGNPRCLKAILRELESDARAKYREEDIWGRSALHITVSLGFIENARMLLQRPTLSLDVQDNEGRTPLDYLFKNYEEFDEKYLESQHTSERHEGLGEGGVVNKKLLLLEFIKSRHAVRALGFGGKSCLHFAVKLDDPQIISELLDNNFDIEARDLNSRTPLHTAIMARAEAAAVGLIRGIGKHLADCAARDKTGATPLMLAARQGLQDVAKAILERDQNAWDTTDDNLDTPLHYAAKFHQPYMVEFLVKTGCNPKARNGSDRTPAHDALEEGHDDTAKYLLSLEGSQRDPNTKKAESLILAAARNSCPKSARLIVDRWPNTVNVVDPRYGQTAISLACESGNTEIVQILLSCEEIDLNIRAEGWNDYTPLHIAVYNREPEMVKLLLDSMALNVFPDYIIEVLELAIDAAGSQSAVDCIRTLLFHDRINDELRIKSLTELHTHTELSTDDLLGLVQEIVDRVESIPLPDLLDLVTLHVQGAPANGVLLPIYMKQIMKQEGAWKELSHPLHIAAQIGDIELYRQLVKLGADPTELDADNWTCADIAAEYGHPDLVEELEKAFEENIPKDYKKPDYATPSGLAATPLVGRVLSITPCTRADHESCKFQDIKYLPDDAGGSWVHPLRTTEAIPPAKASPYFYFEVAVLDTSPLFDIGVGFDDGVQTARSRGLGYNKQSWGYHNNGYIYVNDGWGTSPSPDFGPSGRFGVGDVVGVGMDRTTSEGFVTLNGVRLNVGTVFVDTDFEYGPLYPRVYVQTAEDVDVTAHLQVNLGGHPFKYKGPFPPFQSSS